VVVEDWIDYEDGNTKIAIYDRPGDEADAVKFHGLMMFQKEKWVCLSRSSSNEVIRVTDVPSMEFKREPAETVDQALDADLTKYQRPSDASRVDTVSAWFGDGGNFIVNSGLVWLQEMVESQDLQPDSHGYQENWVLATSGEKYDEAVAAHPAGDARNNELKKCPTSVGTRRYQIQTIDDGDGNATDTHIRLREVCNCGSHWTYFKFTDVVPEAEIDNIGTGFTSGLYPVSGGSGSDMMVEITIDNQGSDIRITDMGDDTYLSSDSLTVASPAAGGNDLMFSIKRKWFDVCKACGWTGRPGHLIDGQHRTRGALEIEEYEMLSYNIIEGEHFDDRDRSKIFSEVTNTSEALDALHRVNLAYRGNQSMRVAGVTYDFTNEKFRKSYEIAAALTKGWSTCTTLKNRIHLLPKHPNSSRDRKGKMMDVLQFIKWSTRDYSGHMDEDWWANGGPWKKADNSSELTVAEAKLSFHNYWDAVSAVFSGCWESTDTSTKELQESWIFESIFKLYPALVARIRAHAAGTNDVPAALKFKRYLSYIGGINFANKTAWNKFGQIKAPGGQGKKNHTTKILRGLIADATPTIIGNIPIAIPSAGGVNAWVVGPPTISSITMANRADLGDVGRGDELVSWDADTTCRSVAKANEPHLLVYGSAEVKIQFAGDIYWEGTSDGRDLTIPLPLPDPANLRTTGDVGKLVIKNTNINGLSNNLEIDVSW